MATLTIADLDNGKRDLETVDAVANSPQDFTTTRYGDNVLTLAGALRRLGYAAPIPYASGLTISSTLTTVEHGTPATVYRPDPAIVPFTTGAWDPSQWRVLQNTESTNQVYQFFTLDAAQAAAATLPEGSAIIVEGSSQGHAIGGIYVPDGGTPAVPLKDYADLEAYSGHASLFQLTDVGISGLWAIIPGDSSTSSNGGTVRVLADGRRVRRLFGGEALASWFGASTSNADNAAAIMSALAAVRPLPVRLGAGEFNSGKITLNSFDCLLGMGSEATTLRLKNGAKSDLLYAANSDALWGTNSTDCVIAPRLEGFTLDGNRANNTSGRCLAMYAERPIVHDVVITGAPDDGMRTEWSSSASESQDGLEGRFTKLTIMRNGGHGWRFAGPHDSHVDDVIIFSSSLKADRTYDNLWLEKGNARWSKFHSYSTADILPNRVRTSLFIDIGGSGNDFSESHFEGAATNVRILGNNNIFDDSCRAYYPWDGINFNVAGNGNIIRSYCGEEYRGIGLPAARGVVFAGDLGGATGNYIDIIAVGCGRGSVDFGGSGGANVVTARGYNPLGTDVGFAGNPNQTDEVDIRIVGGTQAFIRQKFGYNNNLVSVIAGLGSTQADATQIPSNVQLFNLNNGAGGSGIRLPNATNVRDGAEITIFNTTASAIKVYPASGGNIAGLGINNPAAIAALKTVRLVVINAAAGQWGMLAGS